jgi:Domain of unknown function (DUF1707)
VIGMGTEKPQFTRGGDGPGEAAGPARIRASDAEREDALRSLAEHYADGRLDRAEFDERADAAFAARTRDQLRLLLRDLPQPAADLARPARRVAPARPPAPALLLVPLLLALGILAALHGFVPFPLIPLLFLVARLRRHGWTD